MCLRIGNYAAVCVLLPKRACVLTFLLTHTLRMATHPPAQQPHQAKHMLGDDNEHVEEQILHVFDQVYEKYVARVSVIIICYKGCSRNHPRLGMGVNNFWNCP